MTIASLIVDVAANTAQLAKDVKGIETQLDTMSGFAKKAGAAIAGAFSIAAVKNAVGQFTEFTGTLTDMAAKTGISTTELQKLKFAAEQNGGSLDKVTGAIGKMGKALVEGKDSTVEAMKRLGLSINDVRQMDPGSAFSLIADKIAQVPSPLERSKLAMELFGKSGAELLPMMTGNLSDTMAAADKLGIVLDESTVAAGDNLGDTMGALQSVGMAILGKVLAPMLPAFQMVAEAMLGAGKIVDYLRDMFDALARMVLIAIKGIVDGAIQIGAFAAKIPGLNKLLGDEASALQAARDASVWLGGAIKGLEQTTDVATVTTNRHRTAVGLMTDEDKKALKVKKEKHVATSEEIHALNLLEVATKRAAAEIRWQEQVQQKANAQMGVAILNIRHLNAQLDSGIKGTRSFAGAIAMVSDEASKFQGNLAATTKKVGLAEQMFGTAQDFGKNLAGTIMGAIQGGGNPVEAAASQVGTMITTHIAKTLTKGGGKLFGTALGGAVEAILPGVGALLGPLIGKIASAFDRNKGRDLVTEFAQGFGGFDALHTQLNTLGDEGERLWIKLTQGVGRNNKDQAKAAIAEVTKALDDQKLKQAEVQSAAEAATAATIAGNEKALSAIKSLDDEIASLTKSIENEAPEEFIGIVEQQTRARIEGLKAEREAASKALEGLTVTMTDSIKDVAEAIRTLPEKIKIELDFASTGVGKAAPESSSTAGLTAGLSAGRVLPVPVRASSGSGDAAIRRDVGAMMADQRARSDADRAFMLVQLPKAITAAMQRAAA